MIKLKDIIKEIEEEELVLSKEEELRSYQLLRTKFLPYYIAHEFEDPKQDEAMYEEHLKEARQNIRKIRRTKNHVLYKTFVEEFPIYLFAEKSLSYPKHHQNEPEQAVTAEIHIGVISTMGHDKGWQKSAWNVSDILKGELRFGKHRNYPF